MKKVGIIQSNYIPWKGYFDFIHCVDEFILFDDVQYTKRDWRNRNKIKTPNGLKWLSIPVEVKGKYFQKIKDTKVADQRWGKQHWESLKHAYSKAAHFKQLSEIFEPLFLKNDEKYLSASNRKFLEEINRFLGIGTKISWSSDYNVVDGKTERLLELCLQAGATKYLSGPAARGYLDVEQFKANGIEVEWMDYGDYPEYEQLYPPFEHGVTVLDLLFSAGSEATRYLKSF